jgi:DNA-binding NarL/FixJ family response regulator
LSIVTAAQQAVAEMTTASTDSTVRDHGTPAPSEPDLTDREIDVLRLVANGLSNRQIADELFLSPATVKRHVANILGKLGLHSRAAAVARTRELGLLPAEM